MTTTDSSGKGSAPCPRQALQTIRQHFHLNQAQAAEVLGVHPNTLYRWERKMQEPGPEHLTAILALANLTVLVSQSALG